MNCRIEHSLSENNALNINIWCEGEVIPLSKDAEVDVNYLIQDHENPGYHVVNPFKYLADLMYGHTELNLYICFNSCNIGNRANESKLGYLCKLLVKDMFLARTGIKKVYTSYCIFNSILTNVSLGNLSNNNIINSNDSYYKSKMDKGVKLPEGKLLTIHIENCILDKVLISDENGMCPVYMKNTQAECYSNFILEENGNDKYYKDIIGVADLPLKYHKYHDNTNTAIETLNGIYKNLGITNVIGFKDGYNSGVPRQSKIESELISVIDKNNSHAFSLTTENSKIQIYNPLLDMYYMHTGSVVLNKIFRDEFKFNRYKNCIYYKIPEEYMFVDTPESRRLSDSTLYYVDDTITIADKNIITPKVEEDVPRASARPW